MSLDNSDDALSNPFKVLEIEWPNKQSFAGVLVNLLMNEVVFERIEHMIGICQSVVSSKLLSGFDEKVIAFM